MNSALVTVIIPVYNAGQPLEECLDLVVSQTYHALEIILVNDGSNDGSGEICDRYAAKDSRIQVWHNTNHGVSYTRNFGIDHSSGDYIMFVDADDRIEPDAVELLISAAEKYSVDLVFGGYGKFNNNRKKDYETRGVLPVDVAPSSAIFQNNREVALLFSQARTSLAAVTVWAKLYRADIIRRFNVRFPENVCYEEDCCFNIEYYRHVSSAYSTQKIIYHYRQGLPSLSKSYDISKFHYLVNGYNKRCELFEELGLKNKIVNLKNIFILVLVTTFQKIEKSALSRAEKIKDYQLISSLPEVKDVVSTATDIPKRTVYRCVISATRKGSGKLMWFWMYLWNLKNRLKSKLKK